jgi:hypothetical protein
MEIELVPDRGLGDPASRAALAALAREGLAEDHAPPGTTSSWRRAGLESAMDRDPSAESRTHGRTPLSGRASTKS